MARTFKLIGPAALPVKDRPKCKMCGKALKPNFKHYWPTDGKTEPTKQFAGTYGKGAGFFCRELHALWWADHTIAAIASGQLIVKKGGSK